MKMNLIRNLVLPWFLFFLFATTAIVVAGVGLHIQAKSSPLYVPFLAIGALLCLFANLGTFRKVGIWISYSLPLSLRYTTRFWVLRAFVVLGVAGLFYLAGQIQWMPLMWQGIVVPIVFTIALFIAVWSLIGAILRWTSGSTFNRTFAFLLSLPVLAAIPATSDFLGETIVTSYQASRPQLVVIEDDSTERISKEQRKETRAPAVASLDKKNPPEAILEKAKEFKAIAESGRSCAEDSKEISAALTHTGPEDVVFWAIRAVKCTDMKSVVGLPKLAKIMTEHSSPRVRAAAIRAMSKFGHENLKNLGYLIVKRINEREDPEVLDAASTVLSRLGDDEKRWVTNRLKGLLDSSKAEGAARVLIRQLKHEDLVSEFVAANLTAGSPQRERAVSMICLLPEASRVIAQPHLNQIVASVKTGDGKDPALAALGCLGNPGFQAIREEVTVPRQLPRKVAARAFAGIEGGNAAEALQTADTCARDTDEEVRKWCSQSLGKIGGPALPKIMDLLKSSDAILKDAGKRALNAFQDPGAKEELEQIRAENSGWMANKKKMQIAKAVDTALLKIENQENQPKPQSDDVTAEQ